MNRITILTILKFKKTKTNVVWFLKKFRFGFKLNRKHPLLSFFINHGSRIF